MRRLLTIALLVLASSGAWAQPPFTVIYQVCYPLTSAQGTQGLAVEPSRGDRIDLVVLEGPGCFMSARVSKQGGSSDLTFVELELDGRQVENISVAAYKNLGLTEDNSYGAMVLSNADSGIDVVTIGFPQPLRFNRSLVLRAVVDETGVAQILAKVVHGR